MRGSDFVAHSFYYYSDRQLPDADLGYDADTGANTDDDDSLKHMHLPRLTHTRSSVLQNVHCFARQKNTAPPRYLGMDSDGAAPEWSAHGGNAERVM